MTTMISKEKLMQISEASGLVEPEFMRSLIRDICQELLDARARIAELETFLHGTFGNWIYDWDESPISGSGMRDLIVGCGRDKS